MCSLRWHFIVVSYWQILQLYFSNAGGEVPISLEVDGVCFEGDGIMTSEVSVSCDFGDFPEALVVER